MKTVILTISAALISITMRPAYSQTQPTIAPTAAPAATATAGETQQLQNLNAQFPEPQAQPEVQPTPATIPQLDTVTDDEGQISTFNQAGQTVTANQAFFQNLGTNGRTCFTCHQPADGMGLGQESATDRFNADPNDPLFRLIDGATCPDDDVSTPAAQAAAYSLLTTSGLIRISLPMQAGFQFEIVNVQDTNGSDCNTNPVTGLTGPQSGFASFYRRPIPTTNLGFDSNIMWDAREPSLQHQAMDATLDHAQATQSPAAPVLQQIVDFETGLFDAQSFDSGLAGISVGAGGDLTGADGSGATGGPVPLVRQLAAFSTGINNPFGGNFNPAIFNIYNAFNPSQNGNSQGGSQGGNSQGGGSATQTAERAMIYAGQQVFNTVQFQITGVNGLNDVQGQPSITGTCGTCHNSPNIGNFTSNQMMDTGVTDVNAPNGASSNLDETGLPIFTVHCIAGPDAGQTFSVTDIGFGMTTGQCADIGKTKVPVIRGIASRSPYFHNGSAQQITNLVQFYNARFNIGLTAQQQADLEVFLEAQ
jgi:cytochrome c peroxidase